MQAGTAFTTLINVAASILLARILLPEQYGTYRVVFSFAGLILLFLSWGVESATPVILSEEYSRQNKTGIKNVLTYFFKVNFYILLMSFLAVFISPILSEKIYGSKEVGYLSRIVILSSAILNFSVLINIILQVKRKVSRAVIFDSSKELLKVSFSLAALFLGLEVAGVLKGQFLASFLIFLMFVAIYAKYISKKSLFPELKEILLNFKTVKIKKYFGFGAFISLDKNISHLYTLLPVFFLGVLYPSEQVAYFNIALKYVTLPLILLAPVSQLLDVRMPQMTAETDAGKFKRNFYKVSLVSGFIVFFLMLPVLILAPFLIKMFYGQIYLNSVPMIYYLAPLPIISGFAVGIGSLFRVLDKLKSALIINAVIVALGIIPAYLSVKNFGVIGLAVVYTLWLSVSNFVSFLYIKKFLK